MFNDHGLIGVGMAAGEMYQENRYERWVQAYVAQGMGLPAAQQAALTTMGLKRAPGTPRVQTLVFRRFFWMAAVIACVVLGLLSIGRLAHGDNSILFYVAAFLFSTWRLRRTLI